ncbi:Lipopolysaccharide export system protein LptA precursor [Candidatus Gullanella endobia]|uniref:Lipopolysaccharide export system protein LptA n=1 Tax=Candidatus Gullanella endobia TaxID=1070130 RepID=A0A143WRB7_9ENTR|nr:lipopolysaccharide transport periplasmic protein LptA [Candidatus Gullanella endobia]CUX96250.1 Lipopolysaccharide export system protein LptA precursor [Candidatus Gullanella endobia]
MKSITYNIFYHLFLASSLILVSSQTLALPFSNDNQRLIHVNSERQMIDMVTNTIIFIGKVVVKYSSIDIHADKVIITRPNGNSGNEVVEGYGNPISFYQLQDDKNFIRGYSTNVRYETANDLVILIGNACIERLGSNVKGDRITYLIKKKHIEAFSDKSKLVTTVLLPAQLQDKNNAKASYNHVK